MMKSILLSLVLVLGVNAFAASEADIPVKTEDLITELKVEAPAAGDTSMEEAAMAAANKDAVESAAPKSEADIPVTLDSKVVAKTADSSLRELMLAAALLAGFGLLAYLGLNKYRSRNPKAVQFQMKVLAQHHLGPKKSLMVVRVAGESVLLGVTDHNINLLKSLSLLTEDLPEESPSDFEGVLNNSVAPAPSKKAAGPTLKKEAATSRFSFRKKATEEAATENEDFAISQIQDVVHRQVRNLKNLE